MKKFVTVLLSLLFVGGGIAGMALMMATAPKPETGTPKVAVPRVETLTAHLVEHRDVLKLNGVVKASGQIALLPRVSGEVMSHDPRFSPGGYFKKGDVILSIDPTDYQLNLASAREAVASAQYQLDLELGRQTVAREEWSIFADSIPTTEEGKKLALREPHLEKARATLESAQAKLEKARLDLERTVVRAPFNALVLGKSTHMGQIVGPTTQLAVLVDADHFWVQASIPYSQLNALTFPTADGREGSKADIRLPSADTTWEGRLLRPLTDLEEAGRMARILIQVDNPLNIQDDAPGSSPLLLGSYTDVYIQGQLLQKVVAIPNRALRQAGEIAQGNNSNGRVWLLNQNNALEVKTVRVIARDDHHAYVSSGLSEGDQVITSSLNLAIEGMKLMSNPVEMAESKHTNRAGGGK